MGNAIAREIGLARKEYEAEKLKQLQEFLESDMNARGLASKHAQAAALILLNDSVAEDMRSEQQHEYDDDEAQHPRSVRQQQAPGRGINNLLRRQSQQNSTHMRTPSAPQGQAIDNNNKAAAIDQTINSSEQQGAQIHRSSGFQSPKDNLLAGEKELAIRRISNTKGFGSTPPILTPKSDATFRPVHNIESTPSFKAQINVDHKKHAPKHSDDDSSSVASSSERSSHKKGQKVGNFDLHAVQEFGVKKNASRQPKAEAQRDEDDDEDDYDEEDDDDDDENEEKHKAHNYHKEEQSEEYHSAQEDSRNSQQIRGKKKIPEDSSDSSQQQGEYINDSDSREILGSISEMKSGTSRVSPMTAKKTQYKVLKNQQFSQGSRSEALPEEFEQVFSQFDEDDDDDDDDDDQDDDEEDGDGDENEENGHDDRERNRGLQKQDHSSQISILNNESYINYKNSAFPDQTTSHARAVRR